MDALFLTANTLVSWPAETQSLSGFRRRLPLCFSPCCLKIGTTKEEGGWMFAMIGVPARLSEACLCAASALFSAAHITFKLAVQV